MSSTPNFSILDTTKTGHKDLFSSNKERIFADIKNAVLGKNYDLSLVFIGNTRSRSLNRTHRGKDKPTNILSFELSNKSGEIFINLPLSRKESDMFDRSPDNFVLFLFIHGLFHLKGLSHGDTMEKAEAKMRKKFHI